MQYEKIALLIMSIRVVILLASVVLDWIKFMICRKKA